MAVARLQELMTRFRRPFCQEKEEFIILDEIFRTKIFNGVFYAETLLLLIPEGLQ